MTKRVKQYNPSSISALKRLGAYFADLVMFLILCIVAYNFAAVPIVRSFPSFKNTYDKGEAALVECRNLIVDSHLIKISDENKEIDLNELFKDDFKEITSGFQKDSSNKYKEMYAYFYLDFVPNLSFEENEEIPEHTIAWVNTRVFKVNDGDSLFTNNGDNTSFATFKDGVKENIQQYIDGEVNAQSEESYNKYIDMMKAAWNEASNVLTYSKEFSAKSEIYGDVSNELMMFYAMPSLIIYTIIYFLYFLLVPALFKKGQTFAKKILHIGVFYEDSTPIKFSTLLVKSIVNYVFMFACFVIIPILTIGTSIVGLPLMKFGKTVIYALSPALVTFLASAVSYVLVVGSMNHQSLGDLALRIVVLKENPDYVEPIEEKENKEEVTEDGSIIQ